MTDIEIGGRLIGENHSPYIIAEACNNFNGDLEVAKLMVIAAKDAGCDAIKFQMRLQIDRLPPDDHLILQDFCAEVGIPYLCTAFDPRGLAMLGDMNVPAIKIGSAECINETFLKEARKLDTPLIISTGGCDMRSVAMIAKYADILLHCTSMYPVPYDKVNLDLINWYGLDFPNCHIGYSDHTKDMYASIGAVALGARVIEKHFILDYRMEATDLEVSLDPRDMAMLVEGCRAVFESKGSHKEFYKEENDKLQLFRS